MKLTIFAATGGIGRQLLGQAIAAGHDVTAVARNPQGLSPVPARAVAASAKADELASSSVPPSASGYRRTNPPLRLPVLFSCHAPLTRSRRMPRSLSRR